MSEAPRHRPAMLLLAAFSRHEPALGWARDRAVADWGEVAMQSPVFHFTETDYYQPTMGQDLRKVFFAFEQPFDPAELADRKLQANQWEAECAQGGDYAESRPLNLDPGYLTLGKLVLASTKDHCHRVYLSRGIYGEVTLYFKHGRWQPREWTYADYRREDYQQFFSQCRELLHRRQREGEP